MTAQEFDNHGVNYFNFFTIVLVPMCNYLSMYLYVVLFEQRSINSLGGSDTSKLEPSLSRQKEDG